MFFTSVLILSAIWTSPQVDEFDQAAIQESRRFLEVVTGPTAATGIQVVYLTEPKAKAMGLIPGRNEYEVAARIRLESTTAKSKEMLKALGIDGVQEMSNIIYFEDGIPKQDSLYLGLQLLHIESAQWNSYKETLPEDAARSEEFTRWVVEARQALASSNDMMSKDFPKESLSQLKYEGIKFYVFDSHREDTVPLKRLLLASGHRVYTTDDDEIARLTNSPEHQASMEHLDAYVSKKEISGAVRLHRIEIENQDGVSRQFMTAFEPEMSELIKRPNAKLHEMNGFVFPHTYKSTGNQLPVGVVPVHCFFDPRTGEHFYTTSDSEKEQLVNRIGAVGNADAKQDK